MSEEHPLPSLSQQVTVMITDALLCIYGHLSAVTIATTKLTICANC